MGAALARHIVQPCGPERAFGPFAAVQRRGAPESEIRFFDVERRADLAVRLPRARYAGAELDADRRGVWFIRTEDGGPRLYHRSLATPATGADSLVFGEQLGPDAALGIRGFSERTLARHRPLPRRHRSGHRSVLRRPRRGRQRSGRSYGTSRRPSFPLSPASRARSTTSLPPPNGSSTSTTRAPATSPPSERRTAACSSPRP